MSSMEFWGAEIKAGETVKVSPNPESIIHLSQAALAESKKGGNEGVPLFVKVDGKKLLLGTLSQDKFPQLAFDVVFEKEVELSHNSKNASVYVTGYQTMLPFDEEEDMYSDEDSEEDEPLTLASNNGAVPQATTTKPLAAKPAAAAAAPKPAAAKADASKQKAKAPQPAKEEDESDDDDDSDDEDMDDSDDDSDEIPTEGASDDSEDEDDSDSDEESESEDEETPTPKKVSFKVDKGKKRANDSAVKTPVPAKKAKDATPQKTDGKKGVQHTATPHPAKGGKASANGAKTPTQKSGGKFSCNSCDRSFGSDAALQSHSKVKHLAK